MDFIFMLTRQDRTIADCLELFELIRPLKLGHVGFKDIGVSPETLSKLAGAIRDSGATVYMEVVSTTPEACLNSARIATELKVDRLLGGTDVTGVQAITKGTKTAYLPFPGFPRGHPTKLAGQPKDVEAHCRDFRDKGCEGADLLAYRATEAEPLNLVRRGAARPRQGASGGGRQRLDSRTDPGPGGGRRRRVHHRLGCIRRVLCRRQRFNPVAARCYPGGLRRCIGVIPGRMPSPFTNP